MVVLNMRIITKHKLSLLINNDNLIKIDCNPYYLVIYFNTHYEFISTKYPQELKKMILETLRGDLLYLISCDNNNVFYISMFENYIKTIIFQKSK